MHTTFTSYGPGPEIKISERWAGLLSLIFLFPFCFLPHNPSKIFPNFSPPTAPMESDAEEEAAATPAAAAAAAAGRLKGSPELTVEADMREMAKTAAWSVSSCKAGNGVAALRDDNLDTYWQ